MTFEADKTIAYWAESSAYDLETGATLLRSKKYRMPCSLVILPSRRF
jgi:hypothetical protein